MLITAQESFLESWQGTWTGDLQVYNWEGLRQEVPMQLEITQLDSISYSWKIHYGDPKDDKGLRNYLIKSHNPARGHYIIDENNGILIDAYYIDGELISTFAVAGNLLSSMYKKVDGAIHFDIYFGSETHTTTGDTIIGEDTIPPVKIYPHRGRQKAILHKKME